MPTNQKIDYVELPARDFNATQSFYEQAFDWKFSDYGPEYRAFSDGQLDGGFYRSNLRSMTDTGAALIILYAENLEQTQNRIVACGGTVVKEVFAFPGGRRFQFADPNGNELAVWSDK